MKVVLMMIQESCPHCQRAFRMMEELVAENPEYAKVEVKVVDELVEREFADSLDYWYVPTYYVDGRKIHEGVPQKNKLQSVYEEALKD